MNKPNGYDNVKTERERVALGPHKAVIKNVEETQSKTGLPMIVVSIDFAPDDEQAGFFAKAYKADEREDKKWPFQANQYIVTETHDGNTMRSFKSFCTAFEDSNDTEIVWGSGFAAQFKGKKIGVTYGEVEEEYNGERKMRTRIRWFFGIKKFDEQVIPAPQYLPDAVKVDTSSSAFDDFMKIPDDVDQLPFH